MTLLDERHVPTPLTTRRHRVASALAVAVAVVLLTTALGVAALAPGGDLGPALGAGLERAQYRHRRHGTDDSGPAARRRPTRRPYGLGRSCPAPDRRLVRRVHRRRGTAYTLAVTEALVLELPLAALAIRLAIRLLDPTELRSRCAEAGLGER